MKHAPSFPPRVRIAVLLAAIAAITLGHYLTPLEHYLLHNIYQRLYYIPVLLACSWFGLRGGLAAAVLCSLAYAPHILLHWAHSQAYQANQVLELGMFGVVAIVAGVLSDRERALRESAEGNAAARDRALRELESTVDSLRQADRLAALGTLAAGMAHEIKNPLGSIGGAAEILAQDYPPDHPRREFLDILREEIRRLTAITGKYLNFARPQPPDLRPVDINATLKASVELVAKSAAGASVGFETRLEPSLPPALADPVQIHQALVNLLLNGIQAMPQGGALELETSSVPRGIEIRVRDHGPGLPEDEVERLFEPFFTTRPGGTGLGLAMSRRIAEAHGGALEAGNAPGGGAIFRLLLPRAAQGERP